MYTCTYSCCVLVFISPRRSCAAKATVVVLCVCLSVCLFVYDYFHTTGYEVVSQAIRIFPRGAHAWGKGRKNTSGKMCKVFIPSSGMLAGPIKFEHSK